MNTKESLEYCRNIILENLQTIQGAPSVQLQEVPPPFFTDGKAEGDEDYRDTKDSNSSASGPSASSTVEGMDVDSRSDQGTNAAGGERSEHPAEFYPPEGTKDNMDTSS